MLVLTREKGQSVKLYDGEGLRIEVVVTDIGKDKVRLGFTAPQSITIDRREIYDRKLREGDPNGT